MVYPRYDLMIADVRSLQTELEDAFNIAQPGVEQVAVSLIESDPKAAKAFLTRYTTLTAQSTLDAWRRLGEFLVVKYSDGVIRQTEGRSFKRNAIGQAADVIRPGYPQDWLEQYVRETGERYLIK